MAETNKKKTTKSNSKKTNTSAKNKKTNSSTAKKSGKKASSRSKDISLPERRPRTGGNDGYSPAAEAGILILLAVCVLLFLANFGIIGAVGNAVAAFLFGLFGSTAYIFPFALFFTVVLLVANHMSSESVIKAVMIWLAYLIVAMFFEMAWSGDFETRKQSFGGDAYYRYGVEYRRGGGLIPGHIYAFMSEALGQFGTVIIMITVLIICIGVLTGRSILRLIKESSREAAESIVDNIEIRQEEIKRDRRRRRREEGVYYGRPQPVGNEISRLKLEPEEEDSDEMKELTASEAEDLDKLEQKLEERILGAKEYTEPEPQPEPEVMREPEPEAEPEPEPMPEPEPEPVREAAPAPVRRAPVKRKVASSTIPDGMVVNENKVSDYVLPPVNMLKKGSRSTGSAKKEQMETAQKLKDTLKSFGVNVSMTDVSQGPTVTRYEMLPEAGVKVSKIVSLTDDIKLALAAESIRIEAPIPGKSAIGIEVPNAENTPVMLRDLIESDEFKNSKSRISFAVGKDIGGKPVIFDIAKMPHVLIAGATGAGKSVCINTIIMSILYKARPDEVKLMMIDPKIVELSIYNGIPHLMTPVVTDPQKAAGALNWSVIEMDRRYGEFAEHAVRDLKGYNAWAAKEGLPPMPQIVIIVDELADLMMTAKSDVETAIVRLAQKARAAGMHLIIATQRPSVDVITGLIKANMPSRVAFTVTSGTDSRTILDMVGAEKLLGKGDMLFYPVGAPKPSRVQGAFVSDEEVEAVAEFIRAQKKDDDNAGDITEAINAAAVSGTGSGSKGASQTTAASADDEDEIFMQAAEFAVNLDKETVSIGLLQRKFRLGFNRAARIMDQLSDEGIVGEEMGTKGRRIIMTPEQFETYKER
ncbi:MAG: DNA translocase FtsK [Lachnospiraceae bacterium]|nr:DNA translocase FtsK [Lachnospiraceae bacterium]